MKLNELNETSEATRVESLTESNLLHAGKEITFDISEFLAEGGWEASFLRPQLPYNRNRFSDYPRKEKKRKTHCISYDETFWW